MLQDVQLAVRMLIRDPGFTFVAVLALSLGIGLNTTVFTLAHAVLFKGLPFEASHQLLHLDLRHTVTGNEMPASWPEYTEWRDRARSFSALAGFRQASMNISETERPPERVQGALVTANLFSLLRVQPVLGRDLRPEDGDASATPVALISHALWRSRYAMDPNVLGQTIKINDLASTIVGVMPPDMRFPQNHDLWRPMVPDAALERRDNRSVRIVVRLAPDVTRAQAQQEMSLLAGQLRNEHPETNKDLDAQLLTFNERFNGGPIRAVFLALLGAVGFVLLIACANVANLLLARSSRRARDVAIRFAMGASRTRVVRQLLVESTLLAFIGGTFGLLLTWAGIRAFDAAVAGSGKPSWIIFSMDLTVFGYMAAICLATGLVFGAAPALQVSRTNVNEILKEGGRGTAGSRRAGRMRSALVVTELALTVVLLIGAGLMVRSFLKLYDVDLGIQHTDRLLTMRADLPTTKYSTPELRLMAFDRILTNVSAVPGVRAAALAQSIPLSGASQQALEIEGRPIETGAPGLQVSTILITPTYFDTVGATIRRGTPFRDADGTDGHLNVIVDERFGPKFLPGDDPLGRRVRFAGSADGSRPPSEWMTIIGVSSAVLQADPQDTDPRSVLYQPYRQRATSNMSILVAAHTNPAALATDVRRAVQAADPDQAVYNVRTMNEALAQARWPYRVFGSMFAIFAIVALALSAVGIYAVTSYAVTQRTAEIGVRMALGAQPGQVRWMVLRQGLVQLAIGLVLGLALGWPLSGVIQAVLVQIPPQDPVTFAGITAILCAVMIVSCLVPARRATKLDPISALRVE